MSQKTRNTLYVQGMILASAGILTRIIGFIYRIPMANILGNQGNGIYSVAFGIYNIALTLSSYSLPLAVSKLISARLAGREYRSARRVMQCALLFALVVGTIACAVLFFGSGFLERLYHRSGLSHPLRILAPTCLVVAFLGVFRGFFQGHQNMVPTALSQIIEQIVNAIVSILAAWQFVRIHADSKEVYAYGAAGGTLGTLAGAAMALALFLFLYSLSRQGLMRAARRSRIPADSRSVVTRSLILTVIPVILSQTIYQIGYTIDDLLYGNIMASKGIREAVASSIQGVFNTQYNQLINLPVAVATSMAATTIPSIVTSYVQGDHAEVTKKIRGVVKFNMVIAFPSAVGLAFLGNPIVGLLFPRLSDYQSLAGLLLATGSSAVVFYALSTITTSILQAGDHMRIPVIHSAVSLGIHIVLVFVLLRFTEMGVYGLIVGNVSFPLLVSLMNCRSIRREMGYRWELKRTFLIPFVSSMIMGLLCFAVYVGIFMVSHHSAPALLAAILVAVAVYAFLILRLQCFSRAELLDLPMGGRIVRLLKI